MITFFKDLLKTKPKEAAASITKPLFFDRNPSNNFIEVVILNTAPTLEHMLSRNNTQLVINTKVRELYQSNVSLIKNLYFMISNEENKKTEIRVLNDTNIYLLLFKKENNLYYIPPFPTEVQEMPKMVMASPLIKESNCQLFSKKSKKFIKHKLLLYQERVCLMGVQKKPKERSISFSDIIFIEEKVIVDEGKNKGNNNLKITTPTKSYLIQLKNEYEYDNWLNIIRGKVKLWKETSIISNLNQRERELYETINKSYDKIINSLFDLNSILSLDKARAIFFAQKEKEKSDDHLVKVKALFEMIVSYKKSIQNGNYLDALLYFDQVTSMAFSLFNKNKEITICSEEYLAMLSTHKEKINAFKELIRKEAIDDSSQCISNHKTQFNQLTPLGLFDELYRHIVEKIFMKVYNEKKEDEDFCKQIEGVLLYYFEKENDYGLVDFTDIHGHVKDFVLSSI